MSWAGAVPEHHPDVCQPDWLPVHEELPHPPNQISLPSDLFARCESPSVISTFVLFDYTPKFTTVCSQVRVNSLVCLGKILEYLDKWYVIDEILPFLQQIPSREPAVLMGILGKDSGHTPPPNSCQHCLLLFDFPTPSLQESISAPLATRSWASPKRTSPPRACPTSSLWV